MLTMLNILLAGQHSSEMEVLRGLVEQLPNVREKTRVLHAGATDFLVDPDFRADVLLLFLGARPEDELAALSRVPAPSRPITLIVCEHSKSATPQVMRLSMQAGARDFIMGPQLVDDTMAALRKILKEELSRMQQGSRKTLTAVVNAKGGAGASTIANVLAHVLTTQFAIRALLLDLDFQFGSQCLRLDLRPSQGLMEALATLESLDEIALTGYVSRHSSGLQVLSCMTKQVILPGEVSEARLGRLLDLVHHSYEHVVVDLPRLIDPVFNMILERASHIVVVLQQDLTNFRDAQRLTEIMTQELNIPAGRIIPVVNRYNTKNPITLTDAERALALGAARSIPNDFNRLQKAADLGIPPADYAPQSPAIRAIQQLATTLVGETAEQGKGAFRQFFSRLLPGE